MRQFELRRSYRGKDIAAQILCLDEGVHISLYGGDKPHIGAVGILDPEGRRAVTQFPGHREGVICERWLDALAAAHIKPAVVAAGIHYDHITGEGVEAVLAACDQLWSEFLRVFLSPACHNAPACVVAARSGYGVWNVKSERRILMEYCTQCENHCPADALQCGRGRRAFGIESGEGGHDHHEGRGDHGHRQPLEGALGLLQRCGHALHHGKVGANALDALSDEEQARLTAILTKLLESWESAK